MGCEKCSFWRRTTKMKLKLFTSSLGLSHPFSKFPFAATISLAIFVAGCGGSGESDSTNPGISVQSRVLTVISKENPGLNCPGGGSRVDAGIDSNNTSTLEAPEISSSQYVCQASTNLNSQAGVDGLSSLLRLTNEPAGNRCSDGGTRIDAGPDVNANGALDEQEIRSTQYICNGLAGANGVAGSTGQTSLVQMSAEPAGAHCGAGGTRIDAGVDADRNGTLDRSEIGSTQYVCNGGAGENGSAGSNGTTGQPGLVSLTRLTTEPIGMRCPSGGTRIDAGIDTNRNATLDKSEIDNTKFICNGLTSLVRLTAESAGANCATGGTRIDAGIDINANGLLDATEASSTRYICGGGVGQGQGQGQVGPSGINSLIAISPESAGSNCTYGGNKVNSGLDANASGVLDANEIVASTYICNGAPGSAVNWVHVTGTSVQAQSNIGYLADNAAQVEIRLPTAPQLGDLIEVTGVGLGGWIVTQNSGQAIVTRSLPSAYLNTGAVWLARESGRSWNSIAASADGNMLVAAANAGRIYTSTDAGASWTARGQDRMWQSVASSADGTRLAAVEFGGQIYVSPDGGLSWTPGESDRRWAMIASSANGRKLVAVVQVGDIYTSVDAGATWTPRNSIGAWVAVASSANGEKLVAAEWGGLIHTSTDSGATWAPQASGDRRWAAIASSSDGSKLVAVVAGGQIYTSTDSGVTWTPRETERPWSSVASSADGRNLVAATNGGQLYISTDFGITWKSRDTDRTWWAVASSATGDKLFAVEMSGSIFVSASDRSTSGSSGSVSGSQFDSLKLQYVGGGLFIPLSYSSSSGRFTVR